MSKRTKYRVSHFPQVPCKPFIIPCESLTEAVKVRDTLCDYDLFQLEQGIKPDFSNVSVVEYKSPTETEWWSMEDDEIAEILYV